MTNSYITFQYGTLAGYSVLGLSSLQTLLSARKGVKEVLTTIFGEVPLKQRIADAKDKNIFIGFKDICIGSDSLSTRFFHLLKGFEHFSIATICALTSYIIFNKGLQQDPTPSTPLPPVDLEKYQADKDYFIKEFEQAKDVSDAIKQVTQLWLNELDIFTRKLSNKCEASGYFNKNLPSLDSLSDEEKRTLLECLKLVISRFKLSEFFSGAAGQSELNSLLEQEATLKSLTDVAIANGEQKPDSISVFEVLKLASNNKMLKSRLNEYAQETLPGKFDLYFDLLKPLEQAALLSFQHFIETQGKVTWGPFTFNFEPICKAKICEELPTLLSNLPYCRELDKICEKILEKRAEFDQILKYKNDLEILYPSIPNTNAIAIFNQIYEEVKGRGDGGLTESQFLAFKELYKNSSSTKKAS